MKKFPAKLPVQHRTQEFTVTEVERATEDKQALYEVAVSSEYPVKRWWGTEEVLDHGTASVDMGRMRAGAALMHEHDVQIGVVERAWLGEDRVLRAQVRFSRRQAAQDVERDVKDGVVRNVSVGYAIHKVKVEEKSDDGPTKVRVTRWEPMEVSFVAVPADPTVGLGRSAGMEYPVEFEEAEFSQEEERSMKKKVLNERGQVIEVDASDARAALTDEQVAALTATRTPESAPETRSIEVQPDTRTSDLVAIATANGCLDRLNGWIAKGKSFGVREACDEVLELRSTKGTAITPVNERAVALSEKDWKRYSYVKALRGQGMENLDGLEREVHEEILKNLGQIEGAKYRGGVMLPVRLGPEERAYPLDSATSTEGAEFKVTQFMEFIDMLRNSMLGAKLGVRVLSGLVGGLSFPRQTAAGTASWIAEESAVSDSMAAFDNVLMAPKTLMSTTGYTRQLLAQTSYDVEAIVRADLAAIHARALDKAIIEGLGASNQPRGVVLQTGAQVYDIGPGTNTTAVPDLTDLTNMVKLIFTANANGGRLAWAMSVPLAATLSRTLKASSAGSEMLWTGRIDQGQVLGYPAFSSNQVSSVWNSSSTVPAVTGGAEEGIVFGNWEEAMVGMWNALEAIVDPYSAKKSARIEVTTFQLADLAVRHPASFVAGLNAIA